MSDSLLSVIEAQAATLASLELCTPIGQAGALRGKALYAGTDTGPIDVSILLSK